MLKKILFLGFCFACTLSGFLFSKNDNVSEPTVNVKFPGGDDDEDDDVIETEEGVMLLSLKLFE